MSEEPENSWRATLHFLIGLASLDDPALPALADALSRAASSPEAVPAPGELEALHPDIRRIMVDSGYVDRVSRWPRMPVIDGGES